MQSCTEIQALLPLHVGGDLESPLGAGVRAHLDGGCAECAAALSELDRAREALCAVDQRSPAPRVDLWPGVRGALQSEGLLEPASAPVPRPLALVGGRAWLSAAALLIVAGGLFLGLRSEPAAPGTDDLLAETGSTPEIPTVLVGGPGAEALPPGGLRRLAPGEVPMFTKARLFGASHPTLVDDLQRRPALEIGPSRPTLAGDRQR